MVFRRALVALFMMSIGITAIGSSTAHAACTCSSNTRSLDDPGDVAFVGTLVEITDGAWQFEIDRWLTEPRGSAIGIASDNSNDCGLDLPRGERVAIYAQANANGVPSTDMCGVGDAEAALASLEPPSVHPDAGEAQYLIGPGNGPPHYWLTDAEGRIAAFLTTPQRPLARLMEVSLCPGGKYVAERWSDVVTVRDLRSLETIRTEVLPPPDGSLLDYRGLVCRNSNGTTVLVAREFATGAVTKLIRDFVEIGRPAAPLIEGRFQTVDVIDSRHALVTVKVANTRLEILDLATGRSRLVDEARDIEEPVRFPARISGYTASPSGERVVFSIYRPIKGSEDRIDTFVWEVSPSRQIAAYREDADLELTRHWLDEDRLVTTNGNDGSQTVVDALSGRPTGDLAPQAPGPYVTTASGTLAVDSSRFVFFDGEEETTVTQFSNEFLDGPLPLHRPVEITANLPIAVTPPTTPLNTTTTPTSPTGSLTPNGNDVAAAASDEPIDGPTVQWAVAGVLAGLVIVAIALVTSRRIESDSAGSTD